MIRNLAKFISTDLEQIWVSKHFPNHFYFQIIKKNWNRILLLLLGQPAGISWPTATFGLCGPSEGKGEAARQGVGPWPLGLARPRRMPRRRCDVAAARLGHEAGGPRLRKALFHLYFQEIFKCQLSNIILSKKMTSFKNVPKMKVD